MVMIAAGNVLCMFDWKPFVFLLTIEKKESHNEKVVHDIDMQLEGWSLLT
jgi:hypothetical protein